MKIRLLPSSFESNGSASGRQHSACFVINGCVALDAGSLASGIKDEERSNILDVVLTHAHLDHIAGLPLFLDDLFPVLTEPVRVHASSEVIDALETHIFNWKIYPRFSELRNEFGSVIEYVEIKEGTEFRIRDLTFSAIPVNHRVPSNGFLIRDGKSAVAFTGDTAEMSDFWGVVNETENLRSLFIECAFPNEFEELADISHHLTPRKLKLELEKLRVRIDEVYVINIKPAYRETIVSQLAGLGDVRLKVFQTGRKYSF